MRLRRVCLSSHHFDFSFSDLFILAANPNATNEDKGLDVSPPKDEDPDGTKLLQAPDLLERAAKLLKPLATMAKDNVDAWIAIYDVAVRRSTSPVQRILLQS